MRAIKVGIIGAGLIGKKRAAALAAFTDRSTLAAICDVDGERARQLAGVYGAAAYGNWNDLLERNDIDAIVVATPNCYLNEITMASLSSGRHVLCEKPLGRNSKEANAMCSAAEQSGRILKTGFNHRHHPAIWKAKSLAMDGAIGEIFNIRCLYGHGARPGYEKEWRANRELCGGGELLDQGVHVVDLFRWFMGDFSQAYGQVHTFFWNMEVEDNAFAIFTTKDDRVAVMHTSWTQWKNKFLFEVHGDRGYLAIDGLGGSYGTERLIVGKKKRNGEVYVGGAPEEEVLEFPGPDISWLEEWQEFLSAIEENRQPLGSGYDGLMANKMIEAVYRSGKEARPVKI
jgi:predicted dehydrogenase